MENEAVDVSAKFTVDDVVPDVVSAAPGDLVQVTCVLVIVSATLFYQVVYDEGTADLGNSLQVSKTSSQPTVTYSDAERSQLYTVGKEHDS